ncbi:MULTISPECIES: Der GTPase-activating protein YihI [Pseudoalteromonas]|uniref:Der GTPase-activating protein YihI n=1 Tax=Pseudoalteromonas obscura TaxID=3048491 RepID=A0ABT7EPY3_9GAMM|nr:MULTISPECIES: Der GTPase-activating protein YihI [Pseudoalteromonas]MBQ4839448.1 GTPase-activating protein [Pseudoalteromonas luteoviolacea]MDK2597112.1 Der GTPase-activating protein YihI [Pseudoalteromonas sp. P94(2023)]
MTRKKKSRKLGENGTPRLSKEKLQELRAMKEQRVKKNKGNKAGSRNAQEAKIEIKSQAGSQKDPRAGSKKKIALTPEAVQPQTEPQMKRHLTPQVTLTKAKDPELTLEQELQQLENDERLMKLLERHERGELLTGKDAKFFNRAIARHQELCEILGIDDEFEEEDMIEADPLADFVSNDLADEWLSDDEDER